MSEPVLIVGAGLVGLSTALALHRYGVPAVVVEKHAGTSIQPKARRFTFRTMEVYRSLGVADEVYRAAEGLAAHQAMRAGRTLVESEPLPPPPHVDYSELLTVSPESSCLVAQDLLEPVLLRAARERGIPVHFGTRLVALDADDTGVTARVRAAKPAASATASATASTAASAAVTTAVTTAEELDEREIRAEYVVGADGAHSTVRTLLGIPTSGRGALGDAVNVYFEADLGALITGREFNLCQVQHPVAGGFASVDGRYRWVFMTSEVPTGSADSSSGLTAEDRARWTDVLRAAIGGSADLDIEVRSALRWQPTTRVADKFRAGRVFLAGDAAHVMTPYAALGANTGVQDAANLAWKIAAVREGTAGADLLATYHDERHAAGFHAAEQSALRTGSLTDAPDPTLDHPFALVVGYQYRVGAVVDDGSGPQPRDHLALTGRPGTRLPHVPPTTGLSTLDLVGAGLTLLPGPDADGWRTAAGTLGIPVRDPGPDWPAAAGIEPTGALLVRPDHIVAWRSGAASNRPESALAAARDAILAR